MVEIFFFGMLDFVELFVHDILVCMVQKYLVGNNRHHRMINNLMYNMVFVVCFFFVGKRGNFHFDLVRDVDSHRNLLKLLM